MDQMICQLSFFKKGETVLDRMHQICLAMWKNCDWPEDWCNSVFVPLLHKGTIRYDSAYLTCSKKADG